GGSGCFAVLHALHCSKTGADQHQAGGDGNDNLSQLSLSLSLSLSPMGSLPGLATPSQTVTFPESRALGVNSVRARRTSLPFCQVGASLEPVRSQVGARSEPGRSQVGECNAQHPTCASSERRSLRVDWEQACSRGHWP